jgi:hypothetical protein
MKNKTKDYTAHIKTKMETIMSQKTDDEKERVKREIERILKETKND